MDWSKIEEEFSKLEQYLTVKYGTHFHSDDILSFFQERCQPKPEYEKDTAK